MPCHPIAGGFVCGPGPMKAYETVDLGVKWCFVCRKRVRFTDKLMGEIDPSWYGPQWFIKCENGHGDGDVFPGRYREPRGY